MHFKNFQTEITTKIIILYHNYKVSHIRTPIYIYIRVGIHVSCVRVYASIHNPNERSLLFEIIQTHTYSFDCLHFKCVCLRNLQWALWCDWLLYYSLSIMHTRHGMLLLSEVEDLDCSIVPERRWYSRKYIYIVIFAFEGANKYVKTAPEYS